LVFGNRHIQELRLIKLQLSGDATLHMCFSFTASLSSPLSQTGFTDANAYIRELTLKSMLALAPKMSNKTLTQNVLKHLSKLQVNW
jgi:hypothetical protein